MYNMSRPIKYKIKSKEVNIQLAKNRIKALNTIIHKRQMEIDKIKKLIKKVYNYEI